MEERIIDIALLKSLPKHLEAWLGVPLAAAAARGDLGIIARRIKARAKIGCFLHGAIARDHVNIVDYMLGDGALVNVRNKEGRTPIHRAAAIGSQKIGSSLTMNGADKYAPDK